MNCAAKKINEVQDFKKYGQTEETDNIRISIVHARFPRWCPIVFCLKFEKQVFWLVWNIIFSDEMNSFTYYDCVFLFFIIIIFLTVIGSFQASIVTEEVRIRFDFISRWICQVGSHTRDWNPRQCQNYKMSKRKRGLQREFTISQTWPFIPWCA